MATSSRGEFGDFLRSRREKLSPDSVGLASSRRRRTPGLRREEVAELAGIGVDWYIRLEQGRTVSPSETTLDALARALRLGKVEQAHLRALARNGESRAFVRETVSEALCRLVNSLDQPAYVTGRRWDLLTWNAAAADILGFGRIAECNQNILAFMFVESEARRLFGATWADEARRMVAQFRPTHDLFADDPAFVELEERLRHCSPEFTTWWNAHDIRAGAAGQKILNHPEKGVLRFDYATFQANDDPSLKLAIYTRV
jgi:transcriptional regulator with XRE-family HTH domain